MMLIVVFIVYFIWCIESRRTNPSYLVYIGSYYGEDGETDRNYYLSQRLTNYNWIGAYTFCRMNGMKLAKLREGTSAMRNFVSLIADTEVFIDTGVSFANIVTPNCSLHSKEFIYVDCHIYTSNFVCEDSEIELPKRRSENSHSAREKFFNYLGDYVSIDNNIPTKSYYISRKRDAPPDEGIKFCQSMNMILTSPQNQEEFDNLRALLHGVKDLKAAISAYRNSNGHWTDNGNELPYKGKWTFIEPYNDEGDHHCLFLYKDVTLNDYRCVIHGGQFICEFNHQGSQEVINDNELTNFFKPMTEGLEINLYLSHKSLKLLWVDSKLMCKSFGMDLFTPESEKDIKVAKKLLLGAGIPTIRIGITKAGSDKWYSIISGQSSKLVEENNSKGDYTSMNFDGGIHVDRNQKLNFLCQRMFYVGDNKTDNAAMSQFYFSGNYFILSCIIHLYKSI